MTAITGIYKNKIETTIIAIEHSAGTAHFIFMMDTIQDESGYQY